MAKKHPSLVDAAKALEIRHGTTGFRKLLKPAQQKEYDEFLDWIRSGTPGIDRPPSADCVKLVSEKYGVKLTAATFRGHLREK